MFESSPGQGLPLFCLLHRTEQAVSTSIMPLSTAPFSSRTAEKQFCVLLCKYNKVVLASKNWEKIQEAEPDACRFKSIHSTANQQMQRGKKHWEFPFSIVAHRSLSAYEWEEE